ncbi:hypothetical protein LZ554_001578 [Drepanopeziza brunnea f. sp. 'monogermtubi']|nr:hypothetical protein LZ554_001578 [Drepanopeziza brunnea f. sp. 'monogermtubi']
MKLPPPPPRSRPVRIYPPIPGFPPLRSSERVRAALRRPNRSHAFSNGHGFRFASGTFLGRKDNQSSLACFAALSKVKS